MRGIGKIIRGSEGSSVPEQQIISMYWVAHSLEILLYYKKWQEAQESLGCIHNGSSVLKNSVPIEERLVLESAKP